MKTSIQHLYSKGFTLIETMVAVSLLVIAALGPLSISATAVQNSLIAKDQIIATYLAQEGIEYVRYVRDSNGIRSISWLTGLDNCVSTTCNIDTLSLSSVSCGGLTCPPLKIESNGYYGLSNSGTNSKFTRTIRIVNSGTDQITVSSEVSWRTGSYSKTFVTEEILYNIS